MKMLKLLVLVTILGGEIKLSTGIDEYFSEIEDVMADIITETVSFSTGSSVPPYVRLYGLSLVRCHLECALRKRCAAFTYKRQYHRCDLIPVIAGVEVSPTTDEGVVLYIATADVRNKILEKCGNLLCEDGDKCTRTENGPVCIKAECAPHSLGPNQIQGSYFNYIGAKIQMHCLDETQGTVIDTTIIKCQKNGLWTSMPLGFCEVSSPSTTSTVTSPLTVTETETTTLGAPTTPDLCEDPWVYVDDNCYLIVDSTPMPWYEADTNCLGYDAELSTVKTAEEHSFLSSVLAQRSQVLSVAAAGSSETYWIAGVYELDWAWKNGDRIDPQFWHASYPQMNGNMFCLRYERIWGEFAWTNAACSAVAKSICKKSVPIIFGSGSSTLVTSDTTTTTTTSSTTGPAELCDPNWQKFGDNCYYFMPELKSKNDALLTCATHNAGLTDVRTDEENEFIADYLDTLDTYPGSENLARDRDTFQSSVSGIFESSLAVDGEYADDGDACAKTEEEDKPWWMVELQQEYKIHRVVIKTGPGCCGILAMEIKVYIGPSRRSTPMVCGSAYVPVIPGDLVIVNCTSGVVGRVVKIQLTSVGQLSICEVEVFEAIKFSEKVNLAMFRFAYQSTVYDSQHAGLAVNGYYSDNDEDTNFYCSHTEKEASPWWMVDLGRQYQVSQINLRQREDCCEDNIIAVYVGLTENYDDANMCAEYIGPVRDDEMVTITCPWDIVGQYVRIVKNTAGALALCDVQIYSSITSEVAYWIGAEQETIGWLWQDKSVIAYSGWNQGYPASIDGADCVRYERLPDYERYKWSNEHCSKLSYGICKKMPGLSMKK